MNSRTQLRALLAIAFFAGLAAAFASGFLVAGALDADEDAGETAPGGPNGAGTSPRDGTLGDGRDSAASSGPIRGCAGLLGEILAGDTLDLGRNAFPFVRLGPGFRRSSFSVDSSRKCGDAVDADVISATSSWLHDETGDYVRVVQTQQAKKTMNFEHPGALNFWYEGYQYRVNVSPSGPVPPDGPWPDDSQLGSEDRALLDTVFAAIAPNLDRSCFHRRTEGGSWSDLAAMGIGDPRGGLPAPLEETGFTLSGFIAAPASCGEPPLDSGSVLFRASFARADEQGFIFVEADESGGAGAPGEGELTEAGVSWTDGRYQFSVVASGAEASRETIFRIAQALDPTFSPRCLRQRRILEDSDLAGLGHRSPAVPDGFAIRQSFHVIYEVGAECPDASAKAQDNYHLSWQIESEGTINKGSAFFVSVTGVREAGVAGKPYGVFVESEVRWTDAKGTQYWVVPAGQPAVSQAESLRLIAQSLDPTLDIDSLVTK